VSGYLPPADQQCCWSDWFDRKRDFGFAESIKKRITDDEGKNAIGFYEFQR
jgi:hypothetical protein